jgi:DNA-binding response OmpR family regulator
MDLAAKILVVDDEPGIRFFLEEMLERQGYQVATADGGHAALERIAAEEFDVVLLDLMMPEVDGLEVLATLHRDSPDTVVIVLTAHASLETAVQALRQGAHDYLFKPCKTVELRESIRRGLAARHQKTSQRDLLQRLEQNLALSLEGLRATMIEQPEAPSPPPATQRVGPSPLADEPIGEEGRFLERGELIVDLMRHVITLRGELLELSPTEFDLLAFLVSEAPRVVSPQELVREVQGYESEQWEASETVRYHVYRIRNKIKQATGSTGVIRTVRGVGYTIAE